ncbi:MAG: hypothetical protein WBA84_11295 [Carnobacterium sp.]|uniref:hypothetical protein n=1 Tax=Carnobacterium sp. TaxID=48221 RepID=UPI003C75718C
MDNTSLLNKWMQFNENNNEKWSIVILLLLSISFTLTDWMLGIFTFTEFILMFIGVCLFISGNYHIRLKQIKWILLILGVIVANLLLNSLSNEQFVLKVGIAGLIKVAFYIMVNMGLYNYITEYNLEDNLLKTLNIIAVIICVIGIYITIALYSDGVLPYEFFWKYTRTDFLSYNYNNLIRTRSIFSEPSYLGYYLNIIISLNLFNKKSVKISSWVTLLLTIMVILTFSYSSIAVLFLIYILYFFNLNKIKGFKWTKKMWVYVISLLAIVLLFKNVIYETLIKRTIDILNGNDFSAIFRIVRSWDYVNKEHIFMGNGMGHTPEIWNIYAYILSDLGLIAFVLFCILSLYLIINNYKMGILFVILNFQKGGYLSSAFWIYLLLLFIYINSNKKTLT